MTTVGRVIKCKAAVLWAKGEPLKIETVEVAPPGSNEVRIKIVSTGLCHTDVHALEGRLFPVYPIILGHEGAGIVESIGNKVTTVKPGDSVLVFIFPNCQQCHSCKLPGRPCDMFLKNGEPRYKVMEDGKSRFTCNGKTVYHFGGSSTFTEYTVCPEISVGKINNNSPLEKVCIYACGFPTGYGAARKIANIQPGTNVAVWGLGGVGLSAVLGAKKAGANIIIGINNGTNKFEAGKKFGCTECISPAKSEKSVVDLVREKTGNQLDYAIVCTGDLKAVNEAIQCVAGCSGTIVFAGITTELISIPGNVFMIGVNIEGCVIGGYSLRTDIPELVEQYLKGDLDTDPLISHTFKLDQINEAFKCLTDKLCLRSTIVM